MKQWARVSRARPCPICGKTDWCGIACNGSAARCMRHQSDNASTGLDGHTGWIHRFKEHIKPMRPEPEHPKADMTAIAVGYFRNDMAVNMRNELADRLAVSVEALEMLGVGAVNPGVASFPSRNHTGQIAGILTRNLEDGSKRYIPGSTPGIFYARGWSKRPGPIFIPEGPTDVAAFISVGLSAIGRPSNVGGVESIRRLTQARAPGRTIIVIGERDRKQDRADWRCSPDCPGCSQCWPGLFGAKTTAEALGCRYVLIPEGHKDFRSYLASGDCWVSLLKMMG